MNFLLQIYVDIQTETTIDKNNKLTRDTIQHAQTAVESPNLFSFMN